MHSPQTPMASFTPWLAKCPLVFNGHLANHGLTSLVKEATGPKLKDYISIVWMQEHRLEQQCCLACRQIILTTSDMLALPFKCFEWITVEAIAASKGDVNAVQNLTCLRINMKGSGIHQNIWLGVWYDNVAGLVLGLPPANERRLYKVTPSLIGWAQTYNQPWC